MRGQTTRITHTASVRTNLTITNPRPVSSLASVNNKNPSNNYTGPATAHIAGHSLRGRLR